MLSRKEKEKAVPTGPGGPGTAPCGKSDRQRFIIPIPTDLRPFQHALLCQS